MAKSTPDLFMKNRSLHVVPIWFYTDCISSGKNIPEMCRQVDLE